MAAQDDLVLGIDAGGTKTVAWLASREGKRLGAGTAGPGNPRAVGFESACQQLTLAIDGAFADASRPRATVASAFIGMAGADRLEEAQRIQQWADMVSLAQTVQVKNDALPVIAAGSPDGWGIALIAGTGSICVGLAPDGRTARSGGWGYLLGDEGSAYWIAVRGLRAAVKSIEGFGRPSQLVPAFLNRLEITQPAQLIPAIYRPEMDRTALAALADVVFATAAAGDPAAEEILNTAANSLSAQVLSVAQNLDLMSFPLALAGGLLIQRPELRTSIERKLRYTSARWASTVTLVPEPVAGAVKLACRT
jgi:N-acetylglucosamine kinase-like BadF-type ATPase